MVIMNIKKLITLGLLGIMTIPQVAFSAEPRTANLFVLYDLDATDLTFCRVTGKTGSAYDTTGIKVEKYISTSGSSTTTSEVTDTDPFSGLAVNDLLFVDQAPGTISTLLRAIAVATSASAVVVNSAWDIENGGTGYTFSYFDQTCGTGATDGWVDVEGNSQVEVTFAMEQVNVTGGVDLQIQCRKSGLNPQAVQVFPSCTTGSCDTYQNYTTAGIASSTTVVDTASWSQCRVGLKIGSADDGGDLTTNAERLTVTLTVTP